MMPLRLLQHGVVLTIALLLLLVLTLLAAASLQGAGNELALAANDQLRQQASAAAENGIETAFTRLPSANLSAAASIEQVMPDGSHARTTTTWRGDIGLLPGYSLRRFVGRGFEIRAIGEAPRAARAERVQGALRIEDAPLAFVPLGARP
ncbi:MAG: PilX N-terminal domain-containing pilus assembly protein [Steroidobacteraceae bacterium]